MTLEKALATLVQRLAARGLDYMVIGGFANLHWGEPRTTLDLDVTVVASDADLVDAAGEIGTVLVPDPADFLDRSRVLPIRLADGTRVDLVAASLSFELDAVARAHTLDIEGVAVRVCSPEDLIIHKVVSERPRDQEDVAGILARRRATLDLSRLQAAVETLSSELDDPSILARYEAAKRSAGL